MQRLATFHFPPVLCRGCTFSSQNSAVRNGEEEKKTLHQDFTCSHPAKATGCTLAVTPCLCALLPSCLVTTICSLASPSTTPPPPPHAVQTQSADTLTPNTWGEEVHVSWDCGQSHGWHHNQITKTGWKEHHNALSVVLLIVLKRRQAFSTHPVNCNTFIL